MNYKFFSLRCAMCLNVYTEKNFKQQKQIEKQTCSKVMVWNGRDELNWWTNVRKYYANSTENLPQDLIKYASLLSEFSLVCITVSLWTKERKKFTRSFTRAHARTTAQQRVSTFDVNFDFFLYVWMLTAYVAWWEPAKWLFRHTRCGDNGGKCQWFWWFLYTLLHTCAALCCA